MNRGYEVRVERLDGRPLAVVQRQVRPAELSRVVPECCGLVWNALRAQGVRGGRHVALYLDDTIRVDIGTEIDVPFVDQGELVHSQTPAGDVATVTHFGPYGTLHAAHAALRAWCKVSGRQLAGPSWEVYGHWEPEWDQDPTKIRTDVCYLLADVA